MKKTLFALAILAGISQAVELQTVVTYVMPESYTAADFSAPAAAGESDWKELAWGSIEGNLETDLQLLGITSTSTTGHYYFNQKGTAESNYTQFSFAKGALTLTGRGREGVNVHTWYAHDVVVDTLLGDDGWTVGDLTSLSITLTGTSTVTDNNQGQWGLYKMSADGTLTALAKIADNQLKGTQEGSAINPTITLTEAQLAGLSSGDKLITLVRNASPGKNIVMSGLKYTALLPEPTTSTLSLLALAALAARRRRK